MDEAALARLLHVRRAALARDDLNLVRECDLALVRAGVTPPAIPAGFELENAVPAPPLEVAVHRRRERLRPKA